MRKELLNTHSMFAHGGDTINPRTLATKVQDLLSNKTIESTLLCAHKVHTMTTG